MRHLEEGDLVLHYYGEDGPEMVAVEHHLQSCVHCASAYEALARTLALVTPPEPVEAPDDTVALRQLLHERGRTSPAAAGRPGWLAAPVATALAWLVPVLYPLSLPVLFTSGRWAHGHPAATLLVVLALLWACAGPFVAVLALHRVADTFDRASARLLALGAVMAATSPPLFLLIARREPGLPMWYGALALAALLALVPWPQTARSTLRLQLVHRLTALVLGLFVLAHIVNQAVAFVSVPAYSAMRGVMRVASQQPVSYAVIVTAVAVQMATGASMGMTRVRAGAFARNLQAVSGWYLAVFLLAHVFSALLVSRPAGVPAVAATLAPLDLLANAGAVAQLPYYLLGVTAFLVHLGVYARLVALVYLAAASVHRLSYAAAVVATTVVVTVGLALCGIHVIR